MPGDGQEQGGGGGGGMSALTPEQLAEMLFKALMNADETMLRALARQAVMRFAGMEPGRPVGGTYYLYRTLRNLELDEMLDRLMEAAQANAPAKLTQLEERLERDEFSDRVNPLKHEIQAEIRRRHVAHRRLEAIALTLPKPHPAAVAAMPPPRAGLAHPKHANHTQPGTPAATP